MGVRDKRAVSKTLAAVILILIIAVAGGAGYYALTQQQSQANPSPSPSPTETPQQSPTASPTPISSTPSPVITISYSKWMGPVGTDLLMDISIKNQGYAGFDTNVAKFYAVLNGTKYDYHSGWTQIFGTWETKVLSNNATYEGTLVFYVPKSDTAEAFTLMYEDSSNNFNIVYEPTT